MKEILAYDEIQIKGFIRIIKNEAMPPIFLSTNHDEPHRIQGMILIITTLGHTEVKSKTPLEHEGKVHGFWWSVLLKMNDFSFL